MATKLSSQLTDYFTNDKLIAPDESPLSGQFIARGSANVLAADSDADDYRLFIVPGNASPVSVHVRSAVITGGTDFDLGIFPFGADGTVKDADILLDGISFATAKDLTYAIPTLVANAGKQYWELAGDTEYTGQQYVIGWTANTVGSADGTIDTILVSKFSGN